MDFNTWKNRLWSFFKNLSTIIYYTFFLFLYLVYIQYFRKAIHLEILFLGTTKPGGAQGGV